MSDLSPFCTCDDLECALHPTNHDRGCAPCIAKNLKTKEMPTCFFKLVDPDHERTADSFEDFAKCALREG